MIYRIFKFVLPPDNWKIPVYIVFTFLLGLIIYLFYVSRAYSYLSDNPSTCVNCHIMGVQYASWFHSSHRNITDCNACHVPQDNIFSHYYFKAKDGLRHATIFTLRKEPQVIHIKEAGIRVVQKNCERCHNHLINQIEENNNRSTAILHNNIYIKQEKEENNDRLCWNCHRYTPHHRVNSLSSSPFALVPLPESPIPNWLNKLMIKENNN